ncbi:hypothetical protein ACWD11_35100 [Streptomyces sp. NPDC002776]
MHTNISGTSTSRPHLPTYAHMPRTQRAPRDPDHDPSNRRVSIPTPTDAALAGMAGSGGSVRLDWITGVEGGGEPWRSWVDEVVASWAACLLAEPRLAEVAVSAALDGGHTAGAPMEFRRLTAPDENDRQAAALLRHPDLLDRVAGLHRAELMDLLAAGQPRAA